MNGPLEWLSRIFSTGRREKPPPEPPPAAIPPPPEVEAKPPAPKVSHRVSRQVIIGLDFGTSGTKVAFRDWGEADDGETLYLVDFGVPQELGFPRFSVPSSLLVEGGNVFFGEVAEERTGPEGILFRALKTRLIAPGNHPPGGALRSALGQVSSDGSGPNLAPELEPDLLATLYLGHILGRAWSIVEKEFPGIQEAEVSVNLDVPVDKIEDSQLKERFKRICALAILLREELPQGVRLDLALRAWKNQISSAALQHLEQEGGRAELVAEAQALIQGVGKAHQWTEGRNYATIDLGAGTTDVGVFRRIEYREKGRRAMKRRVPFYASSTALVGCDAADEALVRTSHSPPGAEQHRIKALRAAKPRLESWNRDDPLPVLPGWELSFEDFHRVVTEVADNGYVHYRKTWGQAYAKDPSEASWKSLMVLVMGGGSLIPEFRHRFSQPPWNRVSHLVLGKIGGLDGAKVTGATSEELQESEIPFLVVANGLTFSPLMMPELVSPSDIEPWRAPSPGPTGVYDVDADDLYPK